MSHRYLLIVFILIFSSLIASAQLWTASSIPDSLKENAHCVIREYIRELELKSVNGGVERTRKVITILDKEGENQAYFGISYDKNSSVIIKQILIYDSSGKQIKKVKPSEITDSPSFSNYSLYSDDRVKFYKPDGASYPYTVEYIYETDMSNLISYGAWRPVSDYDMSLQHSEFTFVYPADLVSNRKETQVALKSTETRKDGKHTDTWEISNLKAIEEEPFDVSLYERIPAVYLMPKELIYDDYKGKVANWEEYGSWINALYEGKSELSETEKLKVGLLLKDIPDTIRRIQTLYKYMQDNTRYVAITLGIGGFQPFDAKTVFETGYGDCKALSNYMHALLKFSGIKSYPALVSAGRYIVSIFPDFPNFQQFNHVILCVPVQKDTIWLECTSQTAPFGFLGDFTDNRQVLLLTEDGGKFSRTKKYDATQNLRESYSLFSVDSTGTANCSLKTTYTGLQYNDIYSVLLSKPEDQKKWLYRNSSLPSPSISDFSIRENKENLPSAVITESVTSRNFGSFSGKYMLLPLNMINAQVSIPKMLKPRCSEILIHRSSLDSDTLVYQLPNNYTCESVPPPKSIKSVFGEYYYSVELKENDVIYTRRFLISEGRYNLSLYKELYEFILAVSKADNLKIMLTKK